MKVRRLTKFLVERFDVCCPVGRGRRNGCVAVGSYMGFIAHASIYRLAVKGLRKKGGVKEETRSGDAKSAPEKRIEWKTFSRL